MKKLKVLAIIPARGGSKGIPLKNIRKIAGEPMIGYTIKEALKTKIIDRVIVSTDHDEIARISKEYGAEVPFKRSEDISEDVPTELVLQHAVNFLKKKENYWPDYVVTLQCTTPLCEAEDMDATIAKVIKEKVEAGISVTEVTEHPHWMFTMKNGRLKPFLNIDLKGDLTVRQKLPKIYKSNGAIFVTRIDILMQQNRIQTSNMVGYVMGREKSIDIDDYIDLELVDILMKNRKSG